MHMGRRVPMVSMVMMLVVLMHHEFVSLFLKNHSLQLLLPDSHWSFILKFEYFWRSYILVSKIATFEGACVWVLIISVPRMSMHFLRENLFVFLFRFIINVVNFQGVEEFFTLVFQWNQFVKLLKFVRFFLVETVINCVVYTLFLLKKFILQDNIPLFFKSVHRALILVFKLSILLFDKLINEQIMSAQVHQTNPYI